MLSSPTLNKYLCGFGVYKQNLMQALTFVCQACYLKVLSLAFISLGI